MAIHQKVGLLGGGQLGRMTYQAALDLDIELHVMDPSADAPCKSASHRFLQGDITDYASVMRFGEKLDIITIEIEKVNADALEDLVEIGKKVFPQPEIIKIIQNKRLQKQFFYDHDFPTADFVLTESKEEIRQHLDFLPAVHKLGKDGYDGKGVQIIATPEDIDKGFDAPAVLEKKIPIDKELSVIVARNELGQIKTYPVTEQVMDPDLNLLDYLIVPTDLTQDLQSKATEIAVSLVEEMGFVGIMAVELFLTEQGSLLINEVAPRTHNSGHYTIEASYTSQFAQHLRAILGLPLGHTGLRSQAAMVNLVGEAGYSGKVHYLGLEKLLAMQDVYLHLYGKKETRPGRKMGHLTILAQDLDDLHHRIIDIKNSISVISLD